MKKNDNTIIVHSREDFFRLIDELHEESIIRKTGHHQWECIGKSGLKILYHHYE